MGADNCPDWCMSVHHDQAPWADHQGKIGEAWSVLASDGERMVEVQAVAVDIGDAEDFALMFEWLAGKTPAEIRAIASNVREAAKRLA